MNIMLLARDTEPLLLLSAVDFLIFILRVGSFRFLPSFYAIKAFVEQKCHFLMFEIIMRRRFDQKHFDIIMILHY